MIGPATRPLKKTDIISSARRLAINLHHSLPLTSNLRLSKPKAISRSKEIKLESRPALGIVPQSHASLAHQRQLNPL
jgi:hypothetical protein